MTWNSPDTRGSWADHGIDGIYLGPAMRHFRAINIWVPLTSAQRVSGTVWWFLKLFVPDDDLLSPDNYNILYPSKKERINPSPDGSDLLEQCIFEPQLGICCVTRMAPALSQDEAAVVPSLHYRCLATQGEYFSTVAQIVQWLTDGPVLQPPNHDLIKPGAAPVTYPHCLPIPIQHEPIPLNTASPLPNDPFTPMDTNINCPPTNPNSNETTTAIPPDL